MFRTNRIALFLAGALMLALSSCANLKDYGAAQTAFSSGAALEIQQQAADADAAPAGAVSLSELMGTEVPANVSGDPGTFYQDALNSVDKALQAQPALAKGSADDNAMALRALCLWQLGRYDEADEQAEAAMPALMDSQDGEDDQRDLSLMQALSGLTKIDRASDALSFARNRSSEVEALISGSEDDRLALYDEMKQQYIDFSTSDEDGKPSVQRALSIIDAAIEDCQHEPTKLYLTLSQLAGIEIWGDMRNNLFRASRQLSVPLSRENEQGWLEDELTNYREARDTSLETLIDRLGGNPNHPLVAHWRDIL